MPAAHLRYPSTPDPAAQPSNALPRLLHTPSGIALVEIQGTIHFPANPPSSSDLELDSDAAATTTEVGRLEFPLYKVSASGSDRHDGGDGGAEEGIWMKKVYMYVGKYQRLVGEVKKLPKALVVIAKSTDQSESETVGEEMDTDGVLQAPSQVTTLDVLDVIRYKIIFSGRPEPVGEG